MDVRTLTGRRRLAVTRVTEKLNTPVQGTAADGLKLALAILHERSTEVPSARVVLVVHDEIVVECPAAEAAMVATRLKDCMVTAMDDVLGGAVPVEVDVSVGSNWADTEPFETWLGRQ